MSGYCWHWKPVLALRDKAHLDHRSAIDVLESATTLVSLRCEIDQFAAKRELSQRGFGAFGARLTRDLHGRESVEPLTFSGVVPEGLN
ncbi:hypothetical protein [Paracoccus luteus]|uniref:hypothetical protein n=1 Tax=Paracoccus luteus TaxID=2508543 RepID=UPI00106F518F|nr:hypothetical protein [Paracoccus luteus]